MQHDRLVGLFHSVLFKYQNNQSDFLAGTQRWVNILTLILIVKTVFIYVVFSKRPLEALTDARRRKRLTQLRINSHRLEVESGRYIKEPISKRIGKCCSLNQVEDEKHLFCISPFFNSKRYMFFQIYNIFSSTFHHSMILRK